VKGDRLIHLNPTQHSLRAMGRSDLRNQATPISSGKWTKRMGSASKGTVEMLIERTCKRRETRGEGIIE